MTLREFRKIIKGLPGDMDIAIEVDSESIQPVCSKTNVVKIKFDDTNEERFVFVINPCYCEEEDLLNDLNLN